MTRDQVIPSYALALMFILFPRFPFWDPALPPSQSVLPVQVEVTETGFCHGVVVWWSVDFEGTELNMDPWNYQQVCSKFPLYTTAYYWCIPTVYSDT